MTQEGETPGAAGLLEAYRERIYRYVLRMVRNAADAEDLTQETFVRAHLRLDSLRDPQALQGWLYRIATHVCVDHLRRRRPDASIDEEGGSEQAVGAASVGAEFPREIEQREMSACVQRYLDFLPDTYRAVILLHDAHALTAPEIAALLGASVGSVKIRLHRARRRLQRLLDEACAFSSDDRGVLVCTPQAPTLVPITRPTLVPITRPGRLASSDIAGATRAAPSAVAARHRRRG
jgi:RNA polymerase sigma-70 factor (ECF subfamily)